MGGMKVAFISGTSMINSALFTDWGRGAVETAWGRVSYRERGGHVIINRHGEGAQKPPHAINHRANIRALADLGFTDVVSVNSVGSLRLNLPPGTLVSCADYVCLQDGPATFFDGELRGGSPGIANNLIPLLTENSRRSSPRTPGKSTCRCAGRASRRAPRCASSASGATWPA
jgi:5'-methylthioadenosine phosphorylase